jgi:hypothetical protein
MSNWKILLAVFLAMIALLILTTVALLPLPDPRLIPVILVSFVLTLLSLALAHDSCRDRPKQ